MSAPIAEVRDYDSLLQVMRTRADQLNVSRETLDYVSGLPSGYTAKVLSPDGPKRIGMVSLGALLGALAMKLVAVPDDEVFARNRLRYEPRDSGALQSAQARWEREPGAPPSRRSRKSRETSNG
jgi:hypothetical protein